MRTYDSYDNLQIEEKFKDVGSKGRLSAIKEDTKEYIKEEEDFGR